MSEEIKKEAQDAELSMDDLSKVGGGKQGKEPDGGVCKYCGCDTFYFDHGDYCAGCGRIWDPVVRK